MTSLRNYKRTKFKRIAEVPGRTHSPSFSEETNQTLEKVVELLDVKYEITWTKKVEEAVEDDDKLIIVMRELNQRQKELKMTQEEFY